MKLKWTSILSINFFLLILCLSSSKGYGADFSNQEALRDFQECFKRVFEEEKKILMITSSDSIGQHFFINDHGHLLNRIDTIGIESDLDIRKAKKVIEQDRDIGIVLIDAHGNLNELTFGIDLAIKIDTKNVDTLIPNLFKRNIIIVLFSCSAADVASKVKKSICQAISEKCNCIAIGPMTPCSRIKINPEEAHPIKYFGMKSQIPALVYNKEKYSDLYFLSSSSWWRVLKELMVFYSQQSIVMSSKNKESNEIQHNRFQTLKNRIQSSIEKLKILIENTDEEVLETSLQIAVFSYTVPFVEFFTFENTMDPLSKEKILNCPLPNETKSSILIYLCKKKENIRALKVIVALLQNPELDVNSQNSDGISALMACCQKGHYRTVEALLFFRKDIDIDIQSNEGKTALHYAFENGHHELGFFILDWSGQPVMERQNLADFINPLDVRGRDGPHYSSSTENDEELISQSSVEVDEQNLIEEDGTLGNLDRTFLQSLFWSLSEGAIIDPSYLSHATPRALSLFLPWYYEIIQNKI